MLILLFYFKDCENCTTFVGNPLRCQTCKRCQNCVLDKFKFTCLVCKRETKIIIKDLYNSNLASKISSIKIGSDVYPTDLEWLDDMNFGLNFSKENEWVQHGNMESVKDQKAAHDRGYKLKKVNYLINNYMYSSLNLLIILFSFF